MAKMETNARFRHQSPPPSHGDPSFNVGVLNEASNQRQDDLRNYSERLTDAKIERIESTVSLRAEFTQLMMKMAADFQQQLFLAEAKRIDAIRAVDVNAVAVASERTVAQATVLANQVAQAAETLRGLVAQTTASFAAQLQQFQTSLSERLTTLEQGSYQTAGKQQVSDPAMLELINKVNTLSSARSESAGKSEGFAVVWAILSVGIPIAIGLAGLAIALFMRAR